MTATELPENLAKPRAAAKGNMNSSMKTPILILSNTQINIDEVIASIGNDSYDIYSSRSEDQALELFSEHKPSIVIFNYEELEDSQRIYLNIYRNGKNTKAVPHNAVLLCRLNDAKVAFDLCMRQIFDDYVIFKPMYDPNRLSLTLRKSRERFVLRAESGIRQQQLSKFSNEAVADSVEDMNKPGYRLHELAGKQKVGGLLMYLVTAELLSNFWKVTHTL